MVEPLRHRQTKEAATDMFDLQPPRHISTLPIATLPQEFMSAMRPILLQKSFWTSDGKFSGRADELQPAQTTPTLL
jgi:hypothetical protein